MKQTEIEVVDIAQVFFSKGLMHIRGTVWSRPEANKGDWIIVSETDVPVLINDFGYMLLEKKGGE